MAGGNQITFGVGFNVNDSSLVKLKQSLKEIQGLTGKDLMKTGNFASLEAAEKELEQIKAQAEQVQMALRNAFNSNLGTTNITKFRAELQNLNISKIAQDWSQAGAAGQMAFNNLATHAMTANLKLKETTSLLDTMKTTLTNTIKWNIASGAINSMTRSIQSAFNYVKVLDASLTDIRIVTGQSREEMAGFAVQANNAAQALGRQTKEYTNAALTFYQQGLGEAEVQARTEATLKAQNVTGAGTEMADYLTAVWNGFKVSAENTELYVDKLALVADSSASNLSELAIAMSKVASTGANLGVNIDQLAAQISTIIATTRQAPQTVGNALKTIYARINDIKSGSDEAEISLGNYTSRMASLGISVLDADGRLKDTGQTMEEIGERWSSMTKEQQIYLAQTMAGQRQMNNLIALFDNWGKYTEMLNVSMGAQGALEEKNARYLDSLGAHLNQFKAATEGLQDTLIDEEAIKSVVDAGTNLVNFFNNLITSMGGVKTVGLALSGVLLSTFSDTLSVGITNFIMNLRNAKSNMEQLVNEAEIIRQFGQTDSKTAQQLGQWAGQANQYQQMGVMSAEDRNALNADMQEYTNIENAKLKWQEAKQAAEDYYNAIRDNDAAAADANATGAAAEKQQQALKDEALILKEIQKNIEGYIDAVQRANRAWEKDPSSTKGLEETERNLKVIKSDLEDIATNGKNNQLGVIDPDQIEKARDALAEMNRLEQQGVDPREYAQKYFETYQSIVRSAQDANRQAQDAFRQGAQGIEESMTHASNSVKAKIKEMLDTQGLKANIQGVINIIGGMGTTVAGFNSIRNAIKTLNDQSLTFIERVGRGLPALTMGFTTLTMGLSKLSKGFKLVKAGVDKLVISKALLASATGTLTQKEIQQALAEAGLGTRIKLVTAALWARVKAIVADTIAWMAKHKLLAALIIVTMALATATMAITKALNAETIAAQKANKVAAEAKERYNDVKQAFEDLKSTIEDYHNAQAALDELVIGTQEWTNALAEANRQVLELLSAYPKLANYVTNTNGRLTIADEGLQEVLNLANQRVTTAQNGVLYTRQQANAANIRVDSQKANSVFGGYFDRDAYYTDAQFQKAFDVKNQLIANGQDLTVANLKNAFQAVGLINNDYNNYDPLIQALAENNATLLELDASMQANTKTNEILSEQRGREVNQIAGNTDYNTADNITQQAVDKMIGLIADDRVQQALYSRNAQLDTTVHQDYAKLMGYDYISNGNGFGNFTDATGQSIQVSDELIRSTLAINDALKEASSSLPDLLENWKKATDGLAEQQQEALLSFIGGKTGDFSGLLKDQYVEVMEAVVANSKEFGFETEEAAREAVTKAEAAYHQAFDHIAKQLEPYVRTAFNNVVNEDTVSPKQAQKIGKMLTNAFVNGGKQGLDQAENIIKEFEGNLSSEEFAKVIDQLSSGASFDAIVGSLDASSLAVEGFTTDLQALIDLLASDKTQTAFEKITGKYKDVYDIIEGLEQGDAISSEHFKTIEDYLGINLAREFFKINEQGEYELINSAQKLNQVVGQIEVGQLLEGFKGAEEHLKNIYELSQTNVDLDKTISATNVGYGAQSLSGENLDLAIARADYARQTGGATGLTAAHATQIYEQLLEGKERGGVGYLDSADLALLNQGAEAFHTINEATEEAENGVRKFMDAFITMQSRLDEDIDTTEYEELIKILQEAGSEIEGLSDEIKTNNRAARNVASDMLRYASAVDKVSKNYEEWYEILSQKQVTKQAAIMKDLRNVYGDILGLDSSAFSAGFITSAENLQKLNAALNGTEEEANAAYNELLDLARQDIVAQLRVRVDPNDLAQFDTDISTIEDYINTVNLEDIEVGATLTGTESVIAALNSIAAAAGMTQGEMDAMVASMGFNAEYEPNTQTETVSIPGGYTATPDYAMGQYLIPTGTSLMDIAFAQGTAAVPFFRYEANEPITQTQEVVAPTLKVKSLTKSAGGDFKKGANGGGGGGKGGGGGGGGKKPKTQKPFKSKIDPYHDVNIKIGDVQEGLEKLQKDRDKLIGSDATSNLREQVELLERQKELLLEKEAIAERELQRHKAELEEMGAVFDGDVLRDGEYERLLQQKKDQINEAIEYFNALSADEQESYQEYLTELQDQYKDLEEALKDYDDTVQLIDDLGLDFQDLINQQIELSIEAFDLEIEVKLDLKDAEQEFNEFKQKVIDQLKDDDYAGLAAASADLMKTYYNVDENGAVGGLVNDLRQHSKEIAHEIQVIMDGGWSEVYGDNLAAATEDLKKYNDELMGALEDMQDVIDETHDHFLDAISAMQDAFDTQQDTFDKLDDLISHDIELLQLVHGEENFDELTNLYQQQVDQDADRLRALQQQQAYWQDKINQYEQGTEEWKAAMENWQAAFEATNEAMITSVQNLQAQWENSINAIMKSLRNETFGGNMDAALEDWDKMTWHSDRYLDSIERANGLLELQHNYIDMINNTNDPRIQEKLAELEEKQLDALANKEHLREIDLKLAQQQLTVLQAQMALEDAQQAKTKMRLRRDSQGNYTYQFVADEDDIQQKTQDYLKALEEYRSMANDSLHQDLEDLRDYTQEYYDALQEAQMKYGDDQQALLEEQNRLYEMYFGDPDGYINALHNDALSSMTDAQEAMFMNLYGLNQSMEEDLFTKFLGPDSEVTEAAQALLGAGGEIPSLLDAFVNDSAATAFANIDEMTQQVLGGEHGLLPEWTSALWNIADQYETNFVPRVVDAMNYLQQANQAYVDGLAVMQGAANRTFEGVAEGLVYDTAYTNALQDATNELLATQYEQVEASEAVYDALMDNVAAFQNYTSAALDAANANYAYWLSLNGQVATSLPYSYSNASSGTVGQSDYTAAPPDGTNLSQQNSNYNHIASYASGGYTGDWDVNSGRMAVLHEKELVLNEADTKNMLDAVKITRTIFDRVQSMNAALIGNLANGDAMNLATAAGETILQDVVINADFPGVEDAAQIKQAFNELINLASQKVSQNRRAY